jgi:hypothetical protein
MRKKYFSQRRKGAKRQRFPADLGDVYFSNEIFHAETQRKNVSRKDAKSSSVVLSKLYGSLWQKKFSITEFLKIVRPPLNSSTTDERIATQR